MAEKILTSAKWHDIIFLAKWQENTMNNQINTQIIFEYLKDNNLSKTAFCKQCNLSHITYEKIINGEDFGIVSLFKIARQLNRPICDFLKQS